MKDTESINNLQRLIREAAAFLRDSELPLEAGNLERLAGAEMKTLEQRLCCYRDLTSRAFERFTDNDMQPPNTELRKWLDEATAIFSEPQ